MKIKVNVRLSECKCEKCETYVSSNDVYCRKCGNLLSEDIIVEKELEKRFEPFQNTKLWEPILTDDEIDALLGNTKGCD